MYCVDYITSLLAAVELHYIFSGGRCSAYSFAPRFFSQPLTSGWENTRAAELLCGVGSAAPGFCVSRTSPTPIMTCGPIFFCGHASRGDSVATHADDGLRLCLWCKMKILHFEIFHNCYSFCVNLLYSCMYANIRTPYVDPQDYWYPQRGAFTPWKAMTQPPALLFALPSLPFTPSVLYNGGLGITPGKFCNLIR